MTPWRARPRGGASPSSWGRAFRWGGSSWTTEFDPANAIAAVSCTGSAFCVSVDENGDASSWIGSTWSASTNINGGVPLDTISCASPTFCVAFDLNGDALTYT